MTHDPTTPATRAKALLDWVKQLAEHTGIPRRSLYYALRRLEGAKALRRTHCSPASATAFRLEVL